MNVKKPQRKSRQRDIIEKELRKLNTHPTAAELYEIVRDIIPKISLGTVYRNLEQLAESGAIQKLENGPSTRFDGEVMPHNHIRCINCDKVADVHDIQVHSPVDKYDTLSGYKVVGFSVEILGLCPDCK